MKPNHQKEHNHNSKEIRNPYFGDRMLTCGSIKEIFQSN